MADAAIERYVYDMPDGSGLDDVALEFLDPDGNGAQPLALKYRYLHGPADCGRLLAGPTPDIRRSWRRKTSPRQWGLLDSGKPDQIEAATEYFVKREQLESLHEGYEIISGFMFGEIAKRMSDEAESGLPHTMSFRFMFPDESFADFRKNETNPRWIWIRNWALMPWLEYSPLKRDGLVEQALEKINSPEWKFQRKKPLETDLW